MSARDDARPHCGTDLRGDEIPVKSQHYYGWNRWDQKKDPRRYAQAEFWMAKDGGAR